MKMSISVNGEQARGSLRQVSQSIEAQALRQAVRRAADKGRTFAGRQIRAEYAIKARDVAPAFSVRAGISVGGVPAATITAAGKRGRNVILFLRQPSRSRVRRSSQIQFQIRRGRVVQIPGSFVVEHNRGRFVARRTGRARLPIESVHTIDVPGMFSARRVMDATIKQIRDEFLPQETARALRDAIRRALSR